MNIKKWLYIIPMWLFLSCDHGDVTSRTYSLENGTERSIMIHFFEAGRLTKTENINGKGTIIEVRVKNTPLHQYIVSGALRSDSAVVFFDENKVKTYVNIQNENRSNIAPLERNILLDNAYEVISEDHYQFIFTEEDYENAEEIDSGE